MPSSLGEAHRSEAVALGTEPPEVLRVGESRQQVGHGRPLRVVRAQRLTDELEERVIDRFLATFEAPDDLELKPFAHHIADLTEQVFRLLARDEPAVDQRRRPTRDDVDLLACSKAGRGHSVVQRGGELEGGLPVGQEPVEHKVGQRGVEQLGHHEAWTKRLPRGHCPVGGRCGLTDVYRQVGLTELGDRLSEPDDGVLPVRYRCVAGVPDRVQFELTDAPLAGLDHVVADTVHIVAEAADLAQHILRADQLSMLLHEETGAVGAALLLVGNRRKNDIARRHSARGVQQQEGSHALHHHVLHVDGATPVEISVADMRLEGVAAPVLALMRNNVHVAGQQQRSAARAVALDAGDQVGAPVRGEDGGLDARCAEPFGDPGDGCSFVSGRIGGIKPEQGGEVGDGL